MPAKTTLKFDIESLNPEIPALEMASKAKKLASDFQSILAERYPGTRVRIAREEGLPIHDALQHLLVHIDWGSIQAGLVEGATSFATSQLLELFKRKLKDLFAKPTSATKAPQRARSSAKKKTSRKAAAKTKTPAKKKVAKKRS